MARLRLNPEPEQAATEREFAPETVATPVYAPVYTPPAPTQMQVERAGSSSEAYSRRFPQVRGGICEYCGVIDPNYPSQYQYKMCGHYRNMNLRCSYCPDSRDPEDIAAHAVLNIAEHPDNPSKLVVWCDSYECSQKHLQRFKRSAA